MARPHPAAAPSVPALRVQLTWRADGTVVFRCVRADGSATWQHHQRAHAGFFPPHDLTHLAVETRLGFAHAFYGLVAAGWELGDFGAPWPRGPLPPEAAAAELIVGFLDRERAAGETWSAVDFNASAALYYADHRLSDPPVLDEAALAAVRADRDALLARWMAQPVGEPLELAWSAPAARGEAAEGVDRARRRGAGGATR